jgi:hypothetical protein
MVRMLAEAQTELQSLDGDAAVGEPGQRSSEQIST